MSTAMLGVLLTVCALHGCDLPRDAQGTLARARGGTLRVGVCSAPPYVVDDGAGEPTGIEAELVRGFAESIDAAIVWERGPSDDLLHRLETFELDVVICGLTERSPWAPRLALTRPYEEQPHPRVLAVAPGENALLTALDRYVADRREALP